MTADELTSVLESLEALLQAHGERHWSAWIEADRRRIAASDVFGLDHLLSAYGGMGSLNDLILCPENGHLIRPDDVRAVNDRLRDLRSRAYDLAARLRDST